MDSDKESVSGAETSRSVEDDRSYWLNREASLEQKIKELQGQLDVHIQREADLEKSISQTQKERNLWHNKETELKTRILQLETERDSWLQKEAGYEEKVNRLVEETATLRSVGVNFEERRRQIEEEKVNFVQRESSAAETIAYLNKDNARLQAQVIELEAFRNDVSRQNQQLKEHVSNLQLKIQDLESSATTRLSSEKTKHVNENVEMNSQLESAQALLAKMISENSTLVEKVNILNAELEQKKATIESYIPNKTENPILKNYKASDIDESSPLETDTSPSSTENLDTASDVGPPMLSDKLVTSEGSDMNQISQESVESGEIVQISLDENDVMIATSATEKADPVPLTDAPLIGAPFRLISFMARYVSGADLVQK
ncbi:uncharacterized protein [Rutidosis leptorrhynchoides]|uniref:uncharacterized protein n=1 Tax=Rutidosis leptorrhynchoides TaxID=125765 RepID=UPI003A9A278A